MVEIKYGNFKICCITCKRTSKRPEKMFKMICVVIIAMYSFTQKNDSVSGMSVNVALRRILTKMAASVFHRI